MSETSERWKDDKLIERIIDNLDGTGTRTTYDAEGNVTSTENLTDLPIPEPPAQTTEERIAAYATAMANAESFEDYQQAAADLAAALQDE